MHSARSGRRLFPKGVVECVQHLFQLAAEDTVEPFEAAALALDGQPVCPGARGVGVRKVVSESFRKAGLSLAHLWESTAAGGRWSNEGIILAAGPLMVRREPSSSRR